MIGPRMGGIVLLLATASAAAAPPEPAFETVTMKGSFVLLTEALKPTGLAYDPEPIAQQVVLKGDEGTITPILSDDASRALFRDDRLRHRKAEVTGRRRPGLPYFQVVSFKVEDQGTLRVPEYFCEVCTISVRFPQICPCCQGEMELRMRPEPQ